jgi:hypothetical protein
MISDGYKPILLSMQIVNLFSFACYFASIFTIKESIIET